MLCTAGGAGDKYKVCVFFQSIFSQSVLACLLSFVSLFYVFQSGLCHVYSGMFCERRLFLVSLVALVALERLFPAVHHHVALQLNRRDASVVALVTFVWLFSCMLPHHVIFQMTSSNAGKLAHCTMYICEAFPQSGSFGAASDGLIELKQSRIDYTCVVSLQCVP